MKNFFEITKKVADVLMMALNTSPNESEERKLWQLQLKDNNDFNSKIEEIVQDILKEENVFYAVNIVKNLFITNITMFNYVLNCLFNHKEEKFTLYFDKNKNSFHMSFNTNVVNEEFIKEKVNSFMKDAQEKELNITLYHVIKQGVSHSEQLLNIKKNESEIMISILPEKEKSSVLFGKTETYEPIVFKNKGNELHDLTNFINIEFILNEAVYFEKDRSDIRKITLFDEDQQPLTTICFSESKYIDNFIAEHNLKSNNKKPKSPKDIEKIKNKLFNNVYMTISEEFKEVIWTQENKENFKQELYEKIKDWIERN